MEQLVSELVKAIKGSRTAPDQVDLPLFNPDTTDAKKWLIEVGTIKAEFDWTDQQLLVRVSKFLKKESKVWLDMWTPETRDWATFQKDFLESFPPKKILGRLLSEAAEFSSDKCNCYETYVYEKLNKLKNVRAQWEEPDLIEIIIYGIREREVQTIANNQNFKKISELIAFLGSLTKPSSSGMKRPFEKNELVSVNSGNKRYRFSDNDNRYKGDNNHQNKGVKRENIKCYKCGQLGHIQARCRSQSEVKSSPHQPKLVEEKNNVCQFCAKAGHSIENCFTRKGIEKRKNTRDVKLCTTGKPVPVNELKIDGSIFKGIIDTGADISLMSDKHLPYFSKSVVPCNVNLSGILPGSIELHQMFKGTVEICNEILKLDFVFAPQNILEYDVIIGANLYEDSTIMSITDSTGTRIFRNPTPSIRRIITSLSLDTEIDVPEQYRLDVQNLLVKFDKMIPKGKALSTVNNATLQIKLKDDFIVSRNPYRLSAVERKAVREIISDLLQNNIIQESSSPFASPIILVRKKDGNYRMCVDYRELNAHTIKDRFPLPLIEDQLDRLGKAKFFTSLDMLSGFHQLSIDPESVPKTAFVTPEGHYEFLRMPFGLANAPAAFQRAINKALGKLKDNVALVYMDDILVPSISIEEGLESLEKVLGALQEAGFSLNLKKCHFFQEKLDYLGQEVSSKGIRPGSQKVEALTKAPSPANVKQVRQFMGLAGYFRKYVPEFASRTACITKLTRNNEPFVWSSDQENAKKYVIDCLVSKPLLSIFDPNLPTELHTDASCIGYGAVLLQRQDGNNKIVGYYSKRTSPAEAKYHSYELETLAVVNALKHFRVYLLGLHFTLVTDCNALKATANKKELLPRVARWWIYMQDFSFQIIYRKGSSLPHVDYLSRNPVTNSVTVRRITDKNENWLYVEQRGDTEINKLINDVEQNLLDKSRYLLKNGILHYFVPNDPAKKPKPIIPQKSRLGLLRIFHDEQCHIGMEKTIESIQKHFWFPKMRHFIQKYIKHCLVCAVKKTRSGPLQGFIQNVDKPSGPMEILHADCLGPLPATSDGFKHILVVVDTFSKFCVLQCLKSVKAEETKFAFQNIISLFGTPKMIIMDAGSNFKNLSLPEYLDALKIDYHYTTPDIHRSNGQVERYMRTIMNLLRVETRIKSEWSSKVWKIQLVLNTTVQKSTNIAPLRALIGVDGATPLIQNLLKNITDDSVPIRNLNLDRERVKSALDSNAKRELRSNTKRRDTKIFQVGDFVLMHRDDKMHQGKLSYEFDGPFEVVGITPQQRYELRRVGKSTITKAAKEQLRIWPSDWSLTVDMPDLLELLEEEFRRVNYYFYLLLIWNLAMLEYLGASILNRHQ